MPTTLSYARFGIESSFGLSPTLIGATNWRYIDPITAGLTTEHNTVERSPRTGFRHQRTPIAGPMTAGGTVSLQLNPEDGIQMLYAALGTCGTTVNGDGTFTHCLTAGNTLRSMFYEEYIHDGTGNGLWNLYPGTVANGFTLNGTIDDALTVDYDLHAAFRYEDASRGAITPIWAGLADGTYLDPFTGVIGSISKEGGAWTDTDNWVIGVTLGTAHRRRWGYRGWGGACVGTVNVTLSCNAYFNSRVELQEFMGDTAHNLAAGPLGLDNGLNVVDNFIFTATTDQIAGGSRYFGLVITLPRVTWETVGPMQELDDCIRLPLTGKASYDQHDLYGLRVCVTNRLTNAQMISVIAT